MRGIIFAALAGAALLFAPVAAEAAPWCGKGKIYRSSLGYCQGKQAAARQGVRVRYAKASIRTA